MNVDPQSVTTLEYLEAIYGRCTTGDVVFVNSVPEKNAKQVPAHFRVSELSKAASFVESYSGTDLYMKINPMDHSKTLARSKFGVGGVDEVKAVVSFHLDVDAGKDDRYLTPSTMLDALEAMPQQPSAIIQTNGDDGGFHAYWLLDEPLHLNNHQDLARCKRLSANWLEELRHHASPGTIDGTANLDRVLRPVGSLRKSGNRVRAFVWAPHRRYRIDDFDVPNRKPPIAQPPLITSTVQGGVASVLDRAVKYLDKMDPAISGQNGHDRCFTAACAMVLGFELSEDEAYGLMARVFNPKCQPPWSDRELRHKVQEAAKQNGDRGYLLNSPPPQYTSTPQAHSSTDVAKAVESQSADEPKEDTGDCRPAVDLLEAYAEKIETANLPQLLKLGSSLDGIEVGETLITLIGAPPGHGKTALASQVMFEGLEHNPGLIAYLCNAEMSFEAIIRRELSRMTRLESQKIRFGLLSTTEKKDIRDALSELRPRMQNLFVFNDPGLESLLRLMKKPPGLVVVDYLQKFAPADKDVRAGVNQVMNLLRLLAKAGHTILALSATKRDTKGKHDSKELGLSSFKESGECEYQADSAYVLRDEGELEPGCDYIRKVTLGHVKNRHGAKVDVPLQFHMPRMEFSAVEQMRDCYSEFSSIGDVESDDYLHDNPFLREVVT